MGWIKNHPIQHFQTTWPLTLTSLRFELKERFLMVIIWKSYAPHSQVIAFTSLGVHSACRGGDNTIVMSHFGWRVKSIPPSKPEMYLTLTSRMCKIRIQNLTFCQSCLTPVLIKFLLLCHAYKNLFFTCMICDGAGNRMYHFNLNLRVRY